ncbi:regulatory signaling modulator protein AmpE [Stutzerimonas urumqiensis]|uniref:regulatory signaling modulator protein AmpE n=1 Tax=Stutzerimonas urumqiensis TaxID=638269 RepID=UPI003BABAB7D
MSFLVLLLVLFVEKFSGLRRLVQRDGPWARALAGCEARGWTERMPWLALGLLVLVPAIVAALVVQSIEPIAYGWLALPLHLLILLYSLGRGDVRREVGPFEAAWRRSDEQGAALAAQRDLGIEAADPGELLARVRTYLLGEAFQGLFVVMFWYVLLGPAVALAYRLIALAQAYGRGEPMIERARQLRHAFEWLPARVLATSFALVGDFSAVNRALLPLLLDWYVSSRQLVALTGCAAIGCEVQATTGDAARLDALWSLVIRAAALWYAAFAVWVLLR